MEMLIVIVILSIIMGAIFTQITQAQRNSSTEQLKLDLFQQTREFTDQMARDLRGAGYPNARNFTNDQLPNTVEIPRQASLLTAVGLVQLSTNSLWYESAAQGDGTVYVVRYRLQQTGLGCPCLQRSLTEKVDGDPITGQTGVDQKYITEVQNVANGTDDDPIFVAYDTAGNPVPLPIDITNTLVANINSIAIKLTVKSPVADYTGKKPSVTMISTVRLTNCSQAFGDTSDTIMGC